MLSFNVLATSTDANAKLRYSLNNGPSGATISEAGVFNWTAADGPGNVTLKIQAADSATPSKVTEQSVPVQIANLPPTVRVGADGTIGAGQAFNQLITISDPGGDALTVMVDYGDGKGAQPLTIGENGSARLSATYPTAGKRTVMVEAVDKDGAKTAKSLSVTVTPGSGASGATNTTASNSSTSSSTNNVNSNGSSAVSGGNQVGSNANNVNVSVNVGNNGSGANLPNTPPRVVNAALMGAKARSSRVRIVFDQPVNVTKNAFSLVDRGGRSIPLNVRVQQNANNTIVLLSSSSRGGVAKDGPPQLMVRSALVRTPNGVSLDGDANAFAGGDYVRVVTRTTGLI